jgi:hypothetical protein
VKFDTLVLERRAAICTFCNPHNYVCIAADGAAKHLVRVWGYLRTGVNIQTDVIGAVVESVACAGLLPESTFSMILPLNIDLDVNCIFATLPNIL